jgi:protein TonB
VSRHGFLRWFGWSVAAHLALGAVLWLALPRLHPPSLGESDAAVTIVALVDASFAESPMRPPPAMTVFRGSSAVVESSEHVEPARTVEPASTNDAGAVAQPAPESIDATPTPIDNTSESPIHEADHSTATALDQLDAREAESAVVPVPERQSMTGTPGDDYRPLVLAILERAKRYPLLAQRRGLEGTVEIAFVIHADGRLSDPELVASSTHHLLDDAALATVRRLRSVPPPPSRIPVRFPARIQYRLDP